MKSMGSKKLSILIGLLFLLVAFSGIQVAKAQDPWDTPEGRACFEQWIREAMGRINAHNGRDWFNARKPWSINRYGILEGNPKYGPTSVSAPDDFYRYKNKYHYMWDYWHIPSGYWPSPKMKEFNEARVPHIRDYVLKCIAGAQPQPSPPATVQDVRWLVDRVWQFGRGDGSVIAARIRLLPDGRIQGYSHPNESRWAFVNNTLVFYHTGGKPSCRFTSVRREQGRLVLSGPFLFNQRITHVLREVGSQPQPTPPATGRVFHNPTYGGYRLDWCRRWAADCGKGAADAFCRSKGYQRAKSWAIDPDIGHRSPTYVIETGQICNQRPCDGFKYIECE